MLEKRNKCKKKEICKNKLSEKKKKKKELNGKI
jgi:hypothetical protein